MNYLNVSYDSNAGYLSAKNEVVQILRSMGDQKSEVELLAAGIMIAKTNIVSRKVIEELHERYVNDPQSLKATLKWVPVDFVCSPSLMDIKSVIREELNFLIVPSDTYKISVRSMTKKVSETELRDVVLGVLRGKEHEEAQREVNIAVYDDKAMISYLSKLDIFIRQSQ